MIICTYLGPLTAGFTLGVLQAHNLATLLPLTPDFLIDRGSHVPALDEPHPHPDWPNHLLLFGGLFGSLALFVLTSWGRLRVLAFAGLLQFLACVLLLFRTEGALWMVRAAEVTAGMSLGIHIPIQQVSSM